ncbi:MAG: hypothetical protein J7L15_02285 [Clostridiales bacterium]|nr:hypothetical protein [Clostridiales bacterium]
MTNKIKQMRNARMIAIGKSDNFNAIGRPISTSVAKRRAALYKHMDNLKLPNDYTNDVINIAELYNAYDCDNIKIKTDPKTRTGKQSFRSKLKGIVTSDLDAMTKSGKASMIVKDGYRHFKKISNVQTQSTIKNYSLGRSDVAISSNKVDELLSKYPYNPAGDFIKTEENRKIVEGLKAKGRPPENICDIFNSEYANETRTFSVDMFS